MMHVVNNISVAVGLNKKKKMHTPAAFLYTKYYFLHQRAATGMIVVRHFNNAIDLKLEYPNSLVMCRSPYHFSVEKTSFGVK
jgi:hypothetical protein